MIDRPSNSPDISPIPLIISTGGSKSTKLDLHLFFESLQFQNKAIYPTFITNPGSIEDSSICLTKFDVVRSPSLKNWGAFSFLPQKFGP